MVHLRAAAKDSQVTSEEKVKLANDVISAVSENEIALYFGVPNPGQEKKERKSQF